MTWKTPGLEFLEEHLLVPAAVHYVILTLGPRLLGFGSISPWIVVFTSLLLVPARLIGGAVYVYHKHRRTAKALGARLPPAVDSKSFGNSALFKRMKDAWQLGYPGDTFWEFLEEYGRVFNFRMMFTDTVFTIDPNDVKRILATDFDNFRKGERFRFALSRVLGSGVFNSDGEMWKFHRSMARPFFARDRVTDLERFDKHIQTAISLFEQRMKKGYAIDFQDLAQRVTMDIASKFLFGTSVRSLDMQEDELPQPYNHPQYQESLDAASQHPANVFSDAFMNAQLVAAARERVGWIWPLFEMFEDKSEKYMEVVNSFIHPIIDDAVKKAGEASKSGSGTEGEKDVGEDETFLDYLARQTSDTAVLKDQALNVLIAGRDTMAATLSFIFCLLSQHPDVQQRLREEVLQTVGPTERPSYEDVKNMNPRNVRECQNGAVWPSSDPSEKPIYIPAGASVPYGILMMHTSEEFWGPDAAEFDPDRFLDDRKKYILANPFIFTPFNAGPRICLGQQLAYNQLSLLTIRFLQAFSSFSMDESAMPPECRVPEDWKHHTGPGRKAKEAFRPKIVLTMLCEGGMWLKARRFGGSSEGTA